MSSKHDIRDPWSRIEILTEQCLKLSTSEIPYVPPQIPDMLSWLLSRLSNSYIQEESVFVAHALERFSNAGKRIHRKELSEEEVYSLTFYPGRKNPEGRRAPGFAEATIETARRLRDLRQIEDVLSAHSVGAVLGGSMSYGKFRNVKGGIDASDIDLLLVVESWNDLSTALMKLQELPFTSDKNIEHMMKRLRKMLSKWAPEEKILFSGKIDLWTEQEDPMLYDLHVSSGYKLSLHCMSRIGVEKMLLKDIRNIAETDDVKSEKFLDYREAMPARMDIQRTFTGETIFVDIDFIEHYGSYARFTSAFVIENGQYYPGMLQGLVLPTFDVLWGDYKFRRLIKSFKWKLIERLRYEKKAFPDNTLRLSFAHTRSDVFARQVQKDANETTDLG